MKQSALVGIETSGWPYNDYYSSKHKLGTIDIYLIRRGFYTYVGEGWQGVVASQTGLTLLPH